MEHGDETGTKLNRLRSEVEAAGQCKSSGRHSEALIHMNAAIALAESIDSVGLSRELLTMYKEKSALELPTDLQTGVNSLQRALELARELNAVEEQLMVLARLAEAHNIAEQPKAALAVLEPRLELAEKFAVPLHLVAAHAELAGTLCDLGHYDRALSEYRAARAILSKEVALPPKVAQQIDRDIQETRRRLGVALLRELPGRLANRANAFLSSTEVPKESPWPVQAALLDAVHGSSIVLQQYLGEAEDDQLKSSWEPIDASELLARVGSMLRQQIDEASPDPGTLPIAARYLIQLDRARRTRRNIEEARKSLARPGPISEATSNYMLYLRSFITSERLPLVTVEPWGEIDLEDILAGLLDKSHCIALGRTELERFGPGRVNAKDADWKNIVRVLGNEARAILVLPVCTKGTCWEIDWVTTNKFLSKTVFVMPPSSDQNRDWWTRKWGELREWAGHMRLRFPEYAAEGSVFRVTRDGQMTKSSFSDLLAFLYNWKPVNISEMMISDMLYGIQQGSADRARDQRLAESETDRANRIADYATRIAALTTNEVEPTIPTLLEELECGDYREFQEWAVDPSKLPESPGVIALFEGPFKLTFVQAADNLRSALEGITNGKRSSFTRGLWNFDVKPHLTQDQIVQLNRGDVGIEQLVSFHVRSWYTYRYLTVDEAKFRSQIVDLVNQGAFERGRPRFMSTA